MFSLNRPGRFISTNLLSRRWQHVTPRPSDRLLAFKTEQLNTGLSKLWEFIKKDPIIPSSLHEQIDLKNLDKPKMAAFDVAIRALARHPYITAVASESGIVPTVLPITGDFVINCFTDPDVERENPVRQFTGMDILDIAAKSIHNQLNGQIPVGISIDGRFIPLDMAMINPSMNTYMMQLIFEELLQKKKFAKSIIPISDAETKREYAHQLMQTKFFRGPDYLETSGVYATLYSSSPAYYAMNKNWVGDDQNFLNSHIVKISSGDHGQAEYQGVIIDPLLTSLVDSEIESNLVITAEDIEKFVEIMQ